MVQILQIFVNIAKKRETIFGSVCFDSGLAPGEDFLYTVGKRRKREGEAI